VAKRSLAFIIFIALLPLASAPSQASPAKIKIGIVYDVGGRGDKSYDDAAALGVDAAKKKFGLSDFDVRELVTTGIDFDRENRIEFLVKAKYDLVIAIGPNFDKAMTFMSEKYPESMFAIVGSSGVESINVSCMAFSADQSAFLAGVMAAANTKSGKVGFIGDSSHPANDATLKNFQAGVKFGSAKVKVISRNSTTSAAEDVTSISRLGADVIFSTWFRNGSVVNAISKLAKRKKTIKLIGVRPDQYFLSTKDAQKFLIGYVNQRYDSATYDLFKAALSGDSITEEVDSNKGVFGRIYNLENNGFELVDTTVSKVAKSALARAKAAILAKKIKLVK
jgi:basic membrane protein A